MLDFRKLLKQGKEAEWVVMLFLRSNTELMKKLGITRCVLTDFLQPDENWDLSIKEVDCNTKKELNTISVEVKKGNTYGRLQTFWAEVISTGSMGYSHYLVHPPKLMVYFDVFTSKLYFYDGEQFVAKIKRLHLAGATSPNSYNTAIGTKFNLEDYNKETVEHRQQLKRRIDMRGMKKTAKKVNGKLNSAIKKVKKIILEGHLF